jgi:hypothetical protein
MFLCVGATSSLLLAGEKKPVVFVADRNSVQVTSTDDTTEVTGGGSGNAMTAATIKDLNLTCQEVAVSLHRRSADYVLIVADTNGFPLTKDKQAVVATGDGEVFFSTSARLLGSAVRDACGAIVKDWSKRSEAKTAPVQ